MIDPAMIHWNPNPEMFPNQPVGLPNYTFKIASDPPHAFNPPPAITEGPYTAQIASDPPSAFNPPPAVTSAPNLQTPVQTPYSPPVAAAPSYGPMQNLALQMAGYGAPTGVRTRQNLSVTPYTPGGGGTETGPGYDGADPNRENKDNYPIHPPALTTPPGIGGGGVQNNNTWINDLINSGYNVPFGQTPGGYSGGGLGTIGSAIGSGLNAIANPIGAIIDAIKGGDDAEEGESSEGGSPNIGSGLGEFGPIQGVPGTPDGYPFAGGGTPVTPIGNLGNALDEALRKISPYFSYSSR